MEGRMKIRTSALVATLVIAMSMSAYAYPRAESGSGGKARTRCWLVQVRNAPGQSDPDRQFDALSKELNLTPAQQKKLAEQRQFQRTQREALQKELSGLRKELTAELNKEKSDPARLNVLVERMKVLAAERVQHRVESILKLKEILTPAQFKMLNEKMEKVHPRKGGRDEKVSRYHDRSCDPCCRIRYYQLCQRLG